MRTVKRIFTVVAIVCAAGWICGGCGEVAFSRYDRGVAADAVYPPDGFHHAEAILVKNCPRDTTARARMIVEYAVGELISLEEFQAQGLVALHPNYVKWAIEAPELFGHLREKVPVDSYYALFYKNNHRTKSRYTALQELGVPEHYWGHDRAMARLPELTDEDYIGSYSIFEREGRYSVDIDVNSGITGHRADPDEGFRVYTTLYRQDDLWLEQHKDRELVRYYNKLRESKRQPPLIYR